MQPSPGLGDVDERRRSSRIVALVALGIAFLVVLAVVIHRANQDDPAPDRSAATLVLPASFGGYVRATDPTSTAILTRASGSEQKKAGVKVMVYTDSRRHRLLISGASAHDAAGAHQILSDVPPETLLSDNLIDLEVIGARDQDPAPFTGPFRCGTGVYSAALHTAVCGWADDDTFAVVVDLSDVAVPRIPAAGLAAVTKALRTRAESR